MKGYTHEQWEQAEAAVRKRAEEASYKASENIESRSVQRFIYNLAKDNIMLGARMLEEELRKTEKENETKEIIDRQGKGQWEHG